MEKSQESCGRIAQKMKFSIKDFFSKCDQIRRLLISREFLFAAQSIFNDFFNSLFSKKYYYRVKQDGQKYETI